MVSTGFLKFPQGSVQQCTDLIEYGSDSRIHPTSAERFKRYSSNHNISSLHFMLSVRRLTIIQPVTGRVPHRL